MTKSVYKRRHLNQGILDLNVIDLILIDHRYLKTCIKIFIDEGADKKLKLALAKNFLAAITKHSLAEKKAVYVHLLKHPELHFNILESQNEHDLIDKKVKALRQRFNNTIFLRQEVETELKTLAELLQKHITEEENELLPMMDEYLEDDLLKELGKSFMENRKFSSQDLKDYPELQDELFQWKDNIQKVSSEYLAKMDKFVENMHH